MYVSCVWVVCVVVAASIWCAEARQVVLEDLAAALKSGHLSGAAVDVYPSEPSQSKCTDWLCALQECPNTILTPHIGGSTEEAQGTE